MASARVAGQSGTDDWEHDPVRAAQVGRDLARILARLHQLEPQHVGYPILGDTPQQALQHFVLDWRERWLRNRVHASPIIAAGYDWLLHNIPDQIDRISVVHGDIGFHNLLVDDGRITAILDWEFAHIGAPAEDLSYCKPLIEDVINWDDFMAEYLANGGCALCDETARFFDVWRSVRNATTCATAWRGFLNGQYPALKMAFQGMPLYRRFTKELAETLLEL